MEQLTRSEGQPEATQGHGPQPEGVDRDRPRSAIVIMRSRDQRTLLPLLAFAALAIGVSVGWRDFERQSRTGVMATQRPYRPRIAVNSCDWPELCLLPGINETRARRIIADRQSHGPFVAPRDLQRVSGIGPKTQVRLSDWLDFSCPIPPPEVGDTERPPSLN